MSDPKGPGSETWVTSCGTSGRYRVSGYTLPSRGSTGVVVSGLVGFTPPTSAATEVSPSCAQDSETNKIISYKLVG